MTRIKLPVDDLLPDITAAIGGGKDVILKSSPGSGKTTRVPPGLLSAVNGQIWVLEPRRIAARLSAMRVSSELGEKPGVTVGWHMRFESNFTDKTRVLFLTEGMFTARLAQNPTLSGVSCVILDEFHERHQQTDVAFALCRQLQATTRPDLRLIVMSATLDTGTLSDAMPGAEMIAVEIPLHPVSVEHWRGDFSENLWERTVSGILQLVDDPRHSGHILAFLPGTSDILRVRSTLQRRLKHDDWILLELRGSLDKTTQDLAFEEASRRKIILSTNIAESSITIPGVTAVVDSGLAKVPSFNFFTGMSTLETRPVSKASIIQRGGRAGRTSAGINLRLFSKHDEASRPDVEVPEISRLDLAQVYMSLTWLAEKTGSRWRPETIPWLAPPDSKQWNDARSLLRLLDIISETETLTRPRVALIPAHPRVARFADACDELGLKDEAPWLAAILANPDDIPVNQGDFTHLGCDLLARYEIFRGRPTQNSNVTRAAVQIARVLGKDRVRDIEHCRPPHELSLAEPLLRAFPDRVLRVRNKGTKANWMDATICGGGDLRVARESAASHGEWLIALDATSARITGSASGVALPGTQANVATVTMASQITVEDLESAPAGFLIREDVSEWDDKAGKSRLLRVTRYGVIPVSSKVLTSSEAMSPEAASGHGEALSRNFLRQWPKPFENSDFFDAYIVRQRLAFEANLVPHAWDKEELKALLIAHICDEATSFPEIAQRPLEEWLRHCVGEEEFTTLRRVAPTSVIVGVGHKVPVHYTETSPPWIEARLQNFFGQAESPKILEGRIPLTLHLLAPNMRALQVTTDLASFWRGVYPNLRNEYQRKYPRHYWPENPLQAEPPPMKIRPRKSK